MTSKLVALAKILLLPRRSAAPAFVRPLQRIFGTTTTDEIGTEPQENDDDDDDDDDDEEEELEEQQQQNKGILLEALMARRGNLNSNSNYTKNHKGEQVGGPITDPIAKHQLREVRNDYYKSAAINNNDNSNNNNSNYNFNFNTQRQDDQDTPPASSSSWSSSVSSPTSSLSQDVVVSRKTPDLSTAIPVGDEYLYLAQ